MTEVQTLKKRLAKIEKQLEKVRGASPLTDGWQTQQLAKKQRKWDVLAQEKMELKWKIEDIEGCSDGQDLSTTEKC